LGLQIYKFFSIQWLSFPASIGSSAGSFFASRIYQIRLIPMNTVLAPEYRARAR